MKYLCPKTKFVKYFCVINAVFFSSLSAVVVSSDNVLLKNNLRIWEVKCDLLWENGH